MWPFKKKPIKPVDLWGGSEGTAVGEYRHKFDEIAQELTNLTWERVYSLYNAKSKCGVVRSDDQVYARVAVHSEAGSTYRAIVRTDLLDKYQGLFEKAFSDIKVTFEPTAIVLKE